MAKAADFILYVPRFYVIESESPGVGHGWQLNESHSKVEDYECKSDTIQASRQSS